MSQRIGKIVQNHLGHAAGAAGKVNQHGVGVFVCLFAGGAHPVFFGSGHFLAEVYILCFVNGVITHQSHMGKAGALFTHSINVSHNFFFIHGGNNLNTCCVYTVFNVLGGQLIGGGNANRANLDECNNADPGFGALFEQQQNKIALANTQLAVNIGGLVAFPLQVGKCIGTTGAAVVTPQQCRVFRVIFCPFVNNIVAKIEYFGNMKAMRTLRPTIG